VKAADEDTLYHVLIVAIESVPDFSIETTPPPLPAEWVAGSFTARATSAHPRAYKGTKHQPPKDRSLAPIDIRPYLCDVGSIKALLSPMWRLLPMVQARLKRAGYSSAVLEEIESEFPQAAHARGALNKKYWTLPAHFVKYIWPLIRWRPSRDVSAYLALYVALELETNDLLLWGVSCLIAASESGQAGSWCRLAAILPAQRRLPFVSALMKTQAYMALSESGTAAKLEEINDLATDE
jgi:hypothetical protein